MPTDVFQITLRALQLSSEKELRKFFDPIILRWFKDRWEYIIAKQKFALRHWYLYGDKVTDEIADQKKTTRITLKAILFAFLPMTNLNNEEEIQQVIRSVSD